MKTALAFLALVFVLSGCGEDGIDGVPTFREETFTMKDGREVQCVVFQAINEGGIDCDWNGVK